MLYDAQCLMLETLFPGCLTSASYDSEVILVCKNGKFTSGIKHTKTRTQFMQNAMTGAVTIYIQDDYSRSFVQPEYLTTLPLIQRYSALQQLIIFLFFKG